MKVLRSFWPFRKSKYKFRGQRLFEEGFTQGIQFGLEMALRTQAGAMEASMTQREREIVERENVRWQKVFDNHRKRESQADSPLALQMYDEYLNEYNKAHKEGRSYDAKTLQAQLAVLGILAGVSPQRPE